MIKEKYTIKDFIPLIIIFSVILLCSIIVPISTNGDWMDGMRLFMGGFFIIFGALKLIKLKAFAEAYQMYDIVAMRFRTYAFVYPFIEVMLGAFYLIDFKPFITNVLTLVVMLVSAIGVYLKLRKKEKILCACLGTVFKVPMTWVTLFEDLLMAIMAIVMLIMSQGGTTQGIFSEIPAFAKSTGETQIIELSDGDTLNLEASIVTQEVGNRTIKRLAYNGQIPGPVIKVKKDSTITVNLINNIDVDTTLHSHGLRLDNVFDGVPGITQDPIKPGETFSYTLNFPDAGVYWYHPHIREDYTQELGLYGNYIVEGEEDYWNDVSQEEYLILDDFLEDGEFDEESITHTLMGRFGDTLLINDKDDFVVEVEQGQINRFYLTNVANTRTFDITFEGAQTKLVGGDIGRIQNEVIVNSTIIAPAERYILELVYPTAGEYPIMHRGKKIGEVVVNKTDKSSKISSFQTLRDNSNDYNLILDNLSELVSKKADKSLSLNIVMGNMMMSGGSMGHMNHGSMMQTASTDGIEWEDGMSMMNISSTDETIEWQIIDDETGKKNMDINWSFKQGDLIKINIYNNPESMHPMQHPIHFHGQRFVILSRDGVVNKNLQWKDTALIPTGQTVEVLVEMSNPGTWMAHCHIAEHMHAGMMFGFEVEN